MQIGLTAHVDEALASQLNLGQTRLEDTLVLHTAHGRDHFVAISGGYGISSPSRPSMVLADVRGPRTDMLRDEHRMAGPFAGVGARSRESK